MLVLVLLALRLALTLVAAPFVAGRLSRALGARVAIGDLSLQPLDFVVTLRDVTVHATEPPGAPAPAQPPIVADRVRVDLQWLPLLHRSLHVRELRLESARLDLDRLPDGEFGLAGVAPANPAGELPAGWSFALDRIALRDSQLRVRDLSAGGAAMLDAAVRTADVSGMQQRPTAFGRAANLRVDALVGGGRVHVRGRYQLRDDGLALDAVVRVTDVPLAQVSAYAAELGWTDVAGQVSGRLRWQREPRRRDLLSGRLVMRQTSVHVGDLSQPALEVRRAVAEIAAIDLHRRRILVESLILHGATLALRPDVGAPIPLIAPAGARPANDRARRGGTADARAGPAPPWSWMIQRFDTAEARLRILAPGGHIDLRTHASAENLGPGAYWSPLRIDVVHHDVAAAFDGTVRFAPSLTIEGRLAGGGIDFPALARGAGLPWAELVQTGRAMVDLVVGFDAAAGDASPVYAHGGIGLTDLWIAGQDPGGVAFGAAAVNLTLEGFALAGRGRPTRIKVADAYVSAPFLLLLRAQDGRLLLPFSQESAPPLDETPEIVIGNLRGGDGRLTIVDLVPTPPVIWAVTRVDGSADAVSLPAFTFDGLQLRGTDRTFGALQLGGSRQGGATQFELSARGLALAATTPYLAVAGLPYHFAAGRGSFTARGSVGRAGWNADAVLTLQAPDLVDDEGALQRAIGIPVPAALDLLRDQNGDATLQVALASPRADGRDAHAERVAAGVRAAITTAREAANFAAVSVLFPPGQVELTAPAMQELDPVARLLSTHPDLVVELSADTSHADRRWLAEQALRAALEKSGAFTDVMRALGVRTERDRIQAALAARAQGAPGRLDPDDQALLERLLAEEPPVDDAQLAALRDARLTRVMNYFADTHGVSGQRVLLQRDAQRGGVALSAVRAQVAVRPDSALDPRGARPLAGAEARESPLSAP